MSYLDAQELPVPAPAPYQIGRYGMYEIPDAAAIVRAWRRGRRPTDRSSGRGCAATRRCSGRATRCPRLSRRSWQIAGRRSAAVASGPRAATRPAPSRSGYLIASGLTGEPTPPVIGSGGAANRNS